MTEQNLTPLSAAYSNAEHSCAVVQTVEAGAVLADADTHTGLWAWVLESEGVTPYEEPLVQRTMTSLEFLDLFTEAEQLAVVQASMQSASINLWWTKLTMATFVDFTDPRLAAGLDAIVAAGLLSPSRRMEIMQ